MSSSISPCHTSHPHHSAVAPLPIHPFTINPYLSPGTTATLEKLNYKKIKNPEPIHVTQSQNKPQQDRFPHVPQTNHK